MASQPQAETQTGTSAQASPDTRQLVMPQEPSSQPVKSTLLERARAAGLVRTRRRGGNHNPAGRGGFNDHPENRYRGGSHKKIPSSQKELKALLAELADESVTLESGDEVQRLVDMLRKMMASKSPVDHMEILNRLVGRQASKVDMTSGGQRLGWGAFIAMTVAPSLPGGGGAAADAGAVVDGDVTDEGEDTHALPDGVDGATTGGSEGSSTTHTTTTTTGRADGSEEEER